MTTNSSMMKSLMAARELPKETTVRYSTGVKVLDEIFTSNKRSGLEAGVYVLGGDAGAGKSTFFLQVMGSFAADGHICVYCAYEGKANITGVIRRIGLAPVISIVDDTNEGWASSTDELCANMRQFATENTTGKPLVVCIDSIKNLDSGSVAARKKAIKKLHDAVHETNTILFVVAHATKESQGRKSKKLEGPSELVGQADVVMYLINVTPEEQLNSGERSIGLDISMKNRFGKTGQFHGFKLRESGFVWPAKIMDAPPVEPVAVPQRKRTNNIPVDQMIANMFDSTFDTQPNDAIEGFV